MKVQWQVKGRNDAQLSAYYQDMRTYGSAGRSEVLARLEKIEEAVGALAERADAVNRNSNPNTKDTVLSNE